MSEPSDEPPTDPHVRLPELRAESEPPASLSSHPAPPPAPPRAGPPPLRPAGATQPRPSPSTPPSIPGAGPPSVSPSAARAAAIPRATPPSSLPRASSPPPGMAPDFLMPRPAAPPATSAMRASSAPDDPWRERIAALEVQLSAARASAARASQDLAALRDRVERAASRLDAIDASVGAAIEQAATTAREAIAQAETTARDALSRAERPLPLSAIDARTTELESALQTARAGVAALRQELAENRRLDEARAVRLTSIEDRVGRLEDDPRPAELRLAIDRLEARLLSSERERHALGPRPEASGGRPPSDDDDDARAAERDAGAVADVLLSRMAELESMVVASGREQARLAAALDSLRGPGPAGEGAAPGAPASPAPTGLRAIPGIGPKLESKLRAAGITEPSALAALTEAERARLAPDLGLKPAKLDALCDAARAR